MSQNTLDQIRTLARKLVQRIREDPVFRELVLNNPDVLLEEGLPEPAVADVLRSTDLPDVSGYLGCSSISSI